MIEFREIKNTDYGFLRKMLYESLFVEEGEDPFPEEIINTPEVSKYIDNWDNLKDFGLIAQLNNKSIGAIWCRLFDKNNKGYGFIDEKTPELSITILPEFRNKGVGTKLMDRFFQQAKVRGHKAISLSVNKKNKAVDLYKRMGFKIVDELETAYTMKIGL
ncbi:GNAT family N-acetyltransferase [Bacteroidota bacterium]